jgi:hypothetical protein
MPSVHTCKPSVSGWSRTSPSFSGSIQTWLRLCRVYSREKGLSDEVPLASLVILTLPVSPGEPAPAFKVCLT